MNEISVNVKQEPGKITWNFEEMWCDDDLGKNSGRKEYAVRSYVT